MAIIEFHYKGQWHFSYKMEMDTFPAVATV